MNDAVKKIFNLIDKANLTAKKVSSDTGITQSLFTEWKKGRSNPSAEKLAILANYFGVSVDYLLGRTDNPAPSRLNADNAIIVKGDYVGPVTEDERAFVEQVLKAYREQQRHDKP